MNNADPQLIAERMRLARRRAELTQEEVARRLGVTEKTYRRWEAVENLGFLPKLDRIAEIYGTTADELMLGIRPDGQPASLEAKVDALAEQLAKLTELLQDPVRLREAADALADEEDKDPV